MVDPNLVSFYDRVARYERARDAGNAAFSDQSQPRRRARAAVTRRRGVLGPVLFLILSGFLLKGAIYHTVGAAAYNDRVARLEAGEGFDRFGAWMMQADPVTRFMATQIGHGIALLKG